MAKRKAPAKKKAPPKKKRIPGKNGGTLIPFSKGTDPRRNTTGKNASIMTEVKKLMNTEDYINLSNVEELETLDNGRKVPTGKTVDVRIKLTTATGLALYYTKRAKSSDRVLIHLVEKLDGKPRPQPEEPPEGKAAIPYDTSKLTTKEKKIFRALLQKMKKTENKE